VRRLGILAGLLVALALVVPTGAQAFNRTKADACFQGPWNGVNDYGTIPEFASVKHGDGNDQVAFIEVSRGYKGFIANSLSTGFNSDGSQIWCRFDYSYHNGFWDGHSGPGTANYNATTDHISLTMWMTYYIRESDLSWVPTAYWTTARSCWTTPNGSTVQFFDCHL
jgi:hypothetical protein